MSKYIAQLSIAASLFFICSTSFASIEFDQNVTPNVIFGSGNANGGFTTDRGNGVEVGLRAKVRFPVPLNQFNSNGDGTYNHAAGNDAGRALWSFEWSINSDTENDPAVRNLNALSYEIAMDFEPSQGTSFLTFDPINLTFADHSFGTNATGPGDGEEAADATAYANLIANRNVAQNSWQLNFFDSPFSSFLFDPNIDATYTFQLSASDDTGVLAFTTIDVIVGAGGAAVPEPMTFLTWCGLIGCAVVAARRPERS